MIDDSTMTLRQVQEGLKDRRLTVVAEETGLSYPTVKKVADGSHLVTLQTLKKLSDYLQ